MSASCHVCTKLIVVVVCFQSRILSCGILETPRFGRKSNFQFTPGAVVTFECNEGFFLNGDRRRTCGEDGRWDLPQHGYTECLREFHFLFVSLPVRLFLPKYKNRYSIGASLTYYVTSLFDDSARRHGFEIYKIKKIYEDAQSLLKTKSFDDD